MSKILIYSNSANLFNNIVCNGILTGASQPFSIWTEFDRRHGLRVASKGEFEGVVRLLETDDKISAKSHVHEVEVT